MCSCSSKILCFFSGTGKTYTGIKLLYLFNEINKIWYREGNEQKQVLFCGPSNKSVDLVASMSILLFYSPYLILLPRHHTWQQC